MFHLLPARASGESKPEFTSLRNVKKVKITKRHINLPAVNSLEFQHMLVCEIDLKDI